jgi:hypothetical protein
MATIFQGDESKFAPAACEFWQVNRIPRSPLYPKTEFLRWLHTDSEENYRVRGNTEFSVDSVSYEFNSLGYRGPSFDCDPGEVGVMFVGDSNTLGLGMPWEKLWSTLVVRQLENRWGVRVRQFNLGWGATGADYAAMMVHQTVDALRPVLVCILWSFVGRMTWFPDARHQVHFIPEWMPEAYVKDHSAFLRLSTESHGFYNYVRNFHLVNERLKGLGLHYFWGNLEQFSPGMLAPYIPLDGYVGSWKPIDLARDGRHAGIKSHAHFANLVTFAIDRANVALSPLLTNFSLEGRTAPSQLTWPQYQPPKPKRNKYAVASSIRELIDHVRLKRRVRAMKRKDPFIY